MMALDRIVRTPRDMLVSVGVGVLTSNFSTMVSPRLMGGETAPANGGARSRPYIFSDFDETVQLPRRFPTILQHLTKL
jgi:hypothetical protein